MKTKEHLEKHDRQIAAIRELIHQGMRLVVDNMRETRKDIRELRAAQKRTEASLKALIDSMRGAGNGHAKTKLDLH
jgi:Spy/CpxP family protein refolding chaperone